MVDTDDVELEVGTDAEEELEELEELDDEV